MPDIRDELEALSQRLCWAVDGQFDFQVKTESEDHLIQRHVMLIDFLVGSARRGLEAERERRAALEALDHAKAQFLVAVSHELRTPLSLILGPLEALLDGAPEPGRSRGLRGIYDQALRLQGLVDDLLDYARLEAGGERPRPRPLELGEAAATLAESCRAKAEQEGLLLDIHVDPAVGRRLIDERMFERIAVNLLSNAIKFTPRGGRVEFHLRVRDDGLELAVLDTGVGIAPEHQQRIFERFYQVDGGLTRPREGAGLGLALVQEYAALLGGRVELASLPGSGSAFRVILPCPPTDRPSERARSRRPPSSKLRRVEAAPEPAPDAERGPDDRPLVLVCDDLPEIRAFVTQVLEHDFRIVEAPDGCQAWEALRTLRPDVILSDVMMPGMSGLELLARIQVDPELRPIPVILLTALAGQETTVSGLDAGAHDYLSKPFSPRDLRARVQAAARSKALYDDLARTREVLARAARRAGMADASASVVHNLGNALNSINLSADALHEGLRALPLERLTAGLARLGRHQGDLADFLGQDPVGQRWLPWMEASLDLALAQRADLEEVTQRLTERLAHALRVVQVQQQGAERLGTTEVLSLSEAIDEALEIGAASFQQAGVRIERELAPLPRILLDKHKLLQILLNLLSNARHAVLAARPRPGLVKVHLAPSGDGARIDIIDNGAGIVPEHRPRIFEAAFTTKPQGHGFGLHTSALLAEELGGRLEFESAGPGQGARFSLELPLRRNGRDHAHADGAQTRACQPAHA